MTKGLIFGKYLPFHNGHKALIEFALTQCDELFAVVCCSNKETMSATLRRQWIEETFPDSEQLQVIELHYDEDELPNTSVSSRGVSRVWADKFLRTVPPVDVVITSEDYGDYVAEYMDIRHIPFDKKRIQVPTSATTIRNDVLANWAFLPPAVKRSYQKKVVLLGTESTGKSSLAKALARELNGALVEEAGRDLIPDSTSFSKEDLLKVVDMHAARIQHAIEALQPIVIIDTDVHITQSYARFQFEHFLDVDPHIYDIHHADLYLYLSADVPYVQDGTRMHEEARHALDASHRQTLLHFGIAFEEIGGNWQERMNEARRRVVFLGGQI